MRSIIGPALRLCALIFLSILAACGGGGSPDSGPSYSISTNNIIFSTTQNGLTPSTQQVTVTVNRGTVYMGIETSGGPFSASFQITGATTGVVTIVPNSPS